MKNVCRLTIAIDGPAGAGKSTVARRVADALGYLYIDSGAMYRAVAWKALQEGLPHTDEDAIVRVAESIDISFHREGSLQRVLVDSQDVSEAIRTQEVANMASVVSAIPGVRHRLVAMQQAMGQKGGVVMEGRDIGTVVFPKAQVKIFLTASVKERARRRFEELKAKGVSAELDRIRAEVEERDLRDSTRAMSPLKPAEDAIQLDTNSLSIDEVVGHILEICRAQSAT